MILTLASDATTNLAVIDLGDDTEPINRTLYLGIAGPAFHGITEEIAVLRVTAAAEPDAGPAIEVIMTSSDPDETSPAGRTDS